MTAPEIWHPCRGCAGTGFNEEEGGPCSSCGGAGREVEDVDEPGELKAEDEPDAPEDLLAEEEA